LIRVFILLFAPAAFAAGAYEWHLPPGFPPPAVPKDNPMSVEKIALGKRLFFEKRLSASGDYSCASCHHPERAYTDGLPRGVGALGDPVLRSTPSLANVAYLSAYTWADPRVRTLEEQMRTPLFGKHPIEIGMRKQEALAALGQDLSYPPLFAAAFPDERSPLTVNNVIKAIAAFERTLISGRSPFDRFLYDDDRTALSESARRGMELFFSKQVGCADCHSGPNFSGPVIFDAHEKALPLFVNTGLYNLDGKGAYPAVDRGLSSITHKAADAGKFRVPTLRNVALTAPYMHDGSVATLEDVIDHYAVGGRGFPRGPAIPQIKNSIHNEGIAGKGSGSLHPFQLSPGERADLIEFLKSLTDESFIAPLP
jgi:cytochrome c peroxidase